MNVKITGRFRGFGLVGNPGNELVVEDAVGEFLIRKNKAVRIGDEQPESSSEGTSEETDSDSKGNNDQSNPEGNGDRANSTDFSDKADAESEKLGENPNPEKSVEDFSPEKSVEEPEKAEPKAAKSPKKSTAG